MCSQLEFIRIYQRMPSHRWDWHWRVSECTTQTHFKYYDFFKKVFKSFFIFAEACFLTQQELRVLQRVGGIKHSISSKLGLNLSVLSSLGIGDQLFTSVSAVQTFLLSCLQFPPPPTQLSETVARKDETQTVWEKITFIDQYLKFNTRSYSDADDFLFEKSCDVFINHFTRIVCE